MVERIFIDNGLLALLCNDTLGSLWDSFLEVAASKGIILEDRRVCVESDPLLFLEFIGHGRILDKIPSTLFIAIKELGQSLFDSTELVGVSEINQILDKMFGQCLAVCQSLSELTPSALITKHQMHKKCLKGKGSALLEPLISSSYLQNLQNNPDSTYLDICRNLAWQVLMINLRSSFDQISTKQHPSLALKLFEPLMASAHHLISLKGIQPNIFRLAESMYLCSIQQQKARMSQDAIEWVKTYQSTYKTCRKGDLCDCIYLDKAMIGHLDFLSDGFKQFPVTVFTCDNPEQVLKRLSLFRNVLEKLKSEVLDWELNPQYCSKVVCIKVNMHCSLIDIVEHACPSL